jgi:hypothetical protein
VLRDRRDEATVTRERAPAAAFWWWPILSVLWLTFLLCCMWEPVVRDSWGHFHWHRTQPMSWDVLVGFAEGQYLHNNPRFGQVITFLLMTPGSTHAIVTPIVYLGMFAVATAIVLGRWPRLTSNDDAFAFLVVTAAICASAPAIGPMLFYRPFSGNYTYTMMLNLIWLLPYRLMQEVAPPPRAPWIELVAAVGMLVLGGVAGECNEHTVPAFGMLALAFAWPAVRARRGVRAWMVAGAVGLVAGWIALLLAPGQDIRYNGLGHEAGVLGRIADRGVGRDLFLLVKPYVYYAVFVVPWLVIAVIARVRARGPVLATADRRPPLVLLAGSLVVTVTLLGSPKEGERLYFAPVVFAAMAAAGAALAATRTMPKLRLALVAISAVAACVICERCIETYAVVGPESEDRLHILSTAAPGSHVTLPRYTREHSHWWLGEDLDADDSRRARAGEFGVADIELAP